MAAALRNALGRARGALSIASQACSALSSTPAAAAALEARPISSMLCLRSFRAAASLPQAAAAGAGEPPAASRPQLPPWTPTRELPKRKVLTKRMGHLLETLEKEKEAEAAATRPLPDFGPGDTVELRLSVPENKRRATTFKGIVIARRNRGIRSTFTLRALLGPLGGIERTFPLYSPHLLELKVLERKNPARAKLYYLRGRLGKEHRVD